MLHEGLWIDTTFVPVKSRWTIPLPCNNFSIVVLHTFYNKLKNMSETETILPVQ
jgi:hypothetical protein